MPRPPHCGWLDAGSLLEDRRALCQPTLLDDVLTPEVAQELVAAAEATAAAQDRARRERETYRERRARPGGPTRHASNVLQLAEVLEGRPASLSDAVDAAVGVIKREVERRCESSATDLVVLRVFIKQSASAASEQPAPRPRADDSRFSATVLLSRGQNVGGPAWWHDDGDEVVIVGVEEGVDEAEGVDAGDGGAHCKASPCMGRESCDAWRSENLTCAELEGPDYGEWFEPSGDWGS